MSSACKYILSVKQLLKAGKRAPQSSEELIAEDLYQTNRRITPLTYEIPIK